MIQMFTGAGVLAMSLAGGALAQSDVEGGDTHYRLFVGDHVTGRVTVIDTSDPDHHWVFKTTGQAKLYSLAGGALVAAVQSDSDAVDFFTSGILTTDHGDHSDIEVKEPAATTTTLTGPRPFHLVEHGGQSVINYDKGGYAEVLDNGATIDGQITPWRFKQARAHHGFVAPMGDAWLSSVASDQEVTGDVSVPRIGLQGFDAKGNAITDIATCTGIHGEAFSGVFLVAGCEEGVLTVTDGGAGPEFGMLEYPDDLPKDATTGTILGSTGIQMFLGNHGADGVVVIDPAEEPHFKRIALPFRRIDFALDPVNPGMAYVLTEDGSLHRIDMLTAKIDASVKVIAPYSMEGHWNDPRPRIALAGDEIFMTDPDAGLIRRISTKDFSETGTIPVDGTPYNITVAGGSGVIH
ncbi:metallochaperone AztD [Paracoccus sp. JM45]|uniref:metallochaperone AztD n=1 Tax=Paracoccus sp. JM45 TaxID=2283626 RepID=UPI000E6C3EF7|nr:metallochaperone AztD [Paracoccus sp. JM45]RJE79147.1 hypothetical protein DWB67_13885 [Paracoccus sp. JM45]